MTYEYLGGFSWETVIIKALDTGVGIYSAYASLQAIREQAKTAEERDKVDLYISELEKRIAILESGSTPEGSKTNIATPIAIGGAALLAALALSR